MNGEPLVSSDALAAVYVAGYTAPSGYGAGPDADQKRQDAGEAALKHFVASLERAGYFPPTIEPDPELVNEMLRKQ